MSLSDAALRKAATTFKATLESILNGTVTHGISLSFVGRYDGSGRLGYLIDQDDLVGEPIPLTIGRSPARSWLWLNQRLTLDHTGRYLKTVEARVSVVTSIEGKRVFGYDFNRDPKNAYPVAHLQVDGTSQRLKALGPNRTDPHRVERVHFPVGGVRFRPSLEDFIELLIVEEFVNAKTNWEAVITRCRKDFHEIQLKAAVRDAPSVAVEQLLAMQYSITPPPE